MALPTDAKTRKETPIFSGVLKYFPDALAAVAHCSWKGNEQHNPGTPLHWDRSKSGDELDALTRHLTEAGTVDTDGIRHSAKVAWRALANLQKEIEAERESDTQKYHEDTITIPAGFFDSLKYGLVGDGTDADSLRPDRRDWAFK